MAYFNNAFQKAFLGTAGFNNASGTTSSEVTKGEFTFVDPNTWTVPADLDATSALKCPLVLVAGSLYDNDKIGPFAGGYKESSKSKLINPKYVTRFYRVDPCNHQQATLSIGNTPYTISGGDDWTIPGQSACHKEFLCGETYYLRVDLKGSPALRFLSRNSYFTAYYNTGCCPADAGAPTPVDGTLVYINWAKQLLTSPLIAPFIQIQLFDYTGASLGTMTKDNVNDPTADWNTYTPTATPDPTTDVPGMYMTGAYVDTQFGDCTFYPTDALQAYLEPIKLYASEVDYTGDVCVFTGLCVANTCAPIQGTGWGETVLRDLILTQGYEQAPFYTGRDLRIREITQGTNVTDSIIRSGAGNQYTRYYIQHSVPRMYNPTGTFDNDQYLLEVIANPTVTTVATANNTTTTVPVSSTVGITAGMSVSINGGQYAGIVASVSAGVSVTFTTTVAITSGATLTFVEASLVAFEGFVNDWLTNVGNSCDLGVNGPVVYACPGVCTVEQPS